MARNQFVVPQFLDVEAKIIGPITARQFLIMLATILVSFIIYRIFLNLFWVVVFGAPVVATGVTFAFAKVNGQPFHYIVVSIVQTLRRPGRRVWDKALRDSDIRALLRPEVKEAQILRPYKQPIERSRLSELALIVNTGGVYEGESEDFE